MVSNVQGVFVSKPIVNYLTVHVYVCTLVPPCTAGSGRFFSYRILATSKSFKNRGSGAHSNLKNASNQSIDGVHVFGDMV